MNRLDRKAHKLFTECYEAYGRGDYETTVDIWEQIHALGRRQLKGRQLPESAREKFIESLELLPRLSAEQKQRMLAALERPTVN